MVPLKITIVGAGKIGVALAATLAGAPECSVEVIDRSEDALDQLRAMRIDVSSRLFRHPDELKTILSGRDVAVAAVPESAGKAVAMAAAQANVHYLDFNGARPELRESLQDLSTRRAIFNGCGVSPGLIANIAWNLLARCSAVTDLVIRVGSIPRYPTNRLGYGQIWNIDGLIDEYTRPSAAIREGKALTLSPLEDHRTLSIDGVGYEEFITAGGIEDLSIFSEFSPKNITFKTIRYPGHLDYMRFLLDDLGLRNRRDMLRSLLCNGLPVIEDDVLMLMVTARGVKDHLPTEKTHSLRFSPSRSSNGFNALVSVATGYAATLLSLLQQGQIPSRGFVEHYRLDAEALLSAPYLKPLLDLDWK